MLDFSNRAKTARHKLSKQIFLLLVLVGLLFSCGGERTFVPKPKGYPKVVYPEKKYDKFDTDYCYFRFEKPAYAITVQDTLFFDEKPEDPCWFNLEIPSLNGTIHCSYKPLNEKNKLDKLIHDTYGLANQHSVRADYINDYVVQTNSGAKGVILEIEGSVASPFQFFLTDSTDHFLRGALYFNARPNADSLKPIVEFVKKDIVHIINTFEWK